MVLKAQCEITIPDAMKALMPKNPYAMKYETYRIDYTFNIASRDGRYRVEIVFGDGKKYVEVIHPEDSIYLEPQINHKFWNESDKNSSLFIFRVGGEINLSVQKEISSFANSERVVENIAWFN